jgi:hypothetical protein
VLFVWTWLGILAAQLAVWVGPFAVVAVERTSRIRLGDRELGLARGWVAVVLGVALLLPALGDSGTRRDAADRSNDRDAQAWLAEVLPVIPENAVLVSWWSTSTPLWYAQKVEGMRPDIFVVDDRTMLDLNLGRAPDVINRYLDERPVYVIRLAGRDTDELLGQFLMTKVASDGNTAVWAVQGRLAAAR